MTATVTVCIPAYRAASFIAQTVIGVLRQTHSDLRVVVAIDPPDDGSPCGTATALAPLMADRRLSVRTNPKRLGWAENVNSMLRDVTTPYFCFLPHDDIWSPLYLEKLMAALAAQPQAIIAYCDILRFGATPPTRKSVILPQGANRVTGLLHFLLQGTEAQMWRGLTRASALARVPGFPTDRHLGFVVECEYALALHGVGAVVHVPQTHYFKRIYAQDTISASRARMLLPLEDCRLGWQEHDRRMQRLLGEALDDMQAEAADRTLCMAAKESALLRRFQQFVQPALTANELSRAEAALQLCAASADPVAGQVAANLHLVLQAHWQAQDTPLNAATAARDAWQAGSTFGSVLAHAQALARQDRPLEALERATEAMRIGHCDDTRPAQVLIDEIYAGLGWGVQT